jgi:tRNA(Ile)-lysidine synthase
MLEKIETVMMNQCALVESRSILVGVSGGPDSLCLLHSLQKAGYPIIAAHFNHRLRPGSHAEAVNVEGICSQLNIPYVMGAGDVNDYAGQNGMSVEEAARHLRYTFLFRQARQHGSQAVAVGHTADDQVETVLMHFLRGAALTGLKGMAYRTVLSGFDAGIPLVRPLLDVWREETETYCSSYGLQPVMDPSNDSMDFTRNRLRRLLIPNLQAYNPRFKEAVWRSVQSLQDDHVLLRALVESAWGECVLQDAPDLVVFSLPELLDHPQALQRYLVRLAIEKLRPGHETTYSVLDRAAEFIRDPSARQADLTGGLRLLREGSGIYVSTDWSRLPVEQWPQMPDGSGSIPVTVPGVVEISNGWRLSSESWRLPALAREQAEQNQDPFQAWLDAELLSEPLVLRERRPGDRFEPLGLHGHSQKLSDFLVNEKVPQRLRDRWPLLCSGKDVIWVPGYRPAHYCRLTPASRKILYFALSRPPGEIPA